MSDTDEDAKFGKCTCGAALIPIWDDWWDDNKHIKGISVLEGITNPKLPDGKIQIKKGPNEVVPESTEYNPFKVDVVGEI